MFLIPSNFKIYHQFLVPNNLKPPCHFVKEIFSAINQAHGVNGIVIIFTIPSKICENEE